jgi:hypothetical protein
MAKRFPRTEADITTLAGRVIDGLSKAAEDYPSPPVSPEELQGKLEAFHAADTATVAAETALRNRHTEKDEALDQLVGALKVDLGYAELAVRDAPQKLNALGWRPPREGTPLQPPGETRDITIVSEGENWTILRWKSPAEGGKPAFYKIHRLADEDRWDEVGTSTNTEQLMSNQPRGVSLNFRVTAVNNAGEGPPSATITVVL